MEKRGYEKHRIKRSYDTFYHEWYPKVFRYLTVNGAGRADAETIAGQIFLLARQQYDLYLPAKASECTWIFSIAMTCLKNMERGSPSEALVHTWGFAADGAEDPVSRAAEMSEFRDRVAEALKRLPEETREIAILKWFHGLSEPEIAKRTGMAPETVRDHLSGALTTLEALM